MIGVGEQAGGGQPGVDAEHVADVDRERQHRARRPAEARRRRTTRTDCTSPVTRLMIEPLGVAAEEADVEAQELVVDARAQGRDQVEVNQAADRDCRAVGDRGARPPRRRAPPRRWRAAARPAGQAAGGARPKRPAGGGARLRRARGGPRRWRGRWRPARPGRAPATATCPANATRQVPRYSQARPSSRRRGRSVSHLVTERASPSGQRSCGSYPSSRRAGSMSNTRSPPRLAA